MYRKKLNKDKIKRGLNLNYEVRVQALKNILKYCSGANIETPIVKYINIKFYFLNRDVFFSRSNNLCIVSGRQNGVYRFFKISRIQLRDSKNNIYGLRKSS